MCRSDGKLKIVPKQIGSALVIPNENDHIDNQRKVERQSTTLRWRVLLLPAAMRAKAISATRTGFHIDEEESKLFQIAMVRCQIFGGWGLSDPDRQSALGDPRSRRPGVLVLRTEDLRD
jgi:hypothetical protein